jgi:hypothetical protein
MLIIMLIASVFTGIIQNNCLHAFSFPTSNVLYPSQITFEKPLEHFGITVYCTGDVGFGINFYEVELPFKLPRVFGAGYYARLEYVVGDNQLYFESGWSLMGIGEQEAEAYLYNITKSLENYMGIQFKNMVRSPYSYQSPVTGGTFRGIKYTCTVTDFNPDVVIDNFLKLKPNEGFMSIVTRKFLRAGDKIFLVISSTTNFAELWISKVVRNCFNFKIGSTYILDVFKLLNITNPITTHPKSEHRSSVSITLLYYKDPVTNKWIPPYAYKAEIIEIKLPFEYKIGSSASAERIFDYIIENRLILRSQEGFTYDTYSLTAGDVIEYMQVKFKIVEYGYAILKIDLTPTTIIGIILVVASCASIPILIRKARKRSPK